MAITLRYMFMVYLPLQRVPELLDCVQLVCLTKVLEEFGSAVLNSAILVLGTTLLRIAPINLKLGLSLCHSYRTLLD